MLKTNTRKARENVRRYIVERFPVDEYETGESFEEIAAYILGDFSRVQKGRRGNRQDLFEDYAQGLPCGGVFDYFLGYDTARDDLAEILEETAEEAAKYNGEKSANVLTYLIFSECQKAAPDAIKI
jgi:hypothetical protein